MSLCCNYVVTILARYIQNLIQFTKFLIMGMLQIKQYIPNKLPSRIYSLDIKISDSTAWILQVLCKQKIYKLFITTPQCQSLFCLKAITFSFFSFLWISRRFVIKYLWPNGKNSVSSSVLWDASPFYIARSSFFSRDCFCTAKGSCHIVFRSPFR